MITSSLDSTIMAGTQSQDSLASAEAFGARHLAAILVGQALWRSASIGTPSSPGDDVTSLDACISQGTILRPQLHDVSFITASGRECGCVALS